MEKIIFFGKNMFNRNPFHYSFIHDDNFKNSFLKINHEIILKRYLRYSDRNLFIVIADIENTPSLQILFSRASRHPKVLIYELLVFIRSFRRRFVNYIIFKLIPKQKKILIALESPLHSPENHKVKYLNKFGKVLTWNKLLTNNITIIYNPWPQEEIRSLEYFNYPKNRSQKICAIYSYFSKSGINDLYSQRQDFIYEWNQNYPEMPIDIFGKGWGYLERFKKNYFGVVEDKIKKLGEYKFCLVFENHKSPYYITEKIFDSLKAGCIPIYFGCKEINTLVPEELYIRINLLEKLDTIFQRLNSITDEDYKLFIKKTKKYFESPQWKLSTSENLAEKIIHNLRG